MERPDQAGVDDRENRVEKEPEGLAVVAVWARSVGKASLFYWRDHNSYDNDPYLLTSFKKGVNTLDSVVRGDVIEALVQEGIDESLARRSIRLIEESGYIYFPDIESRKERRCPMVFVEVGPAVLKKLDREGSHFLLPATVIKPNKRWNDAVENRVERAFLIFAASKSK